MEAIRSVTEGEATSSVEAANVYRFILPTFEGPLDLLLHLIRANELDITDLPVVEIARQYDEMIELMHEMNLEIAGDFLVMAATLVYIKSKMLLPADQERIAAGLEEDPRADLARALLDHQRFKQAAARLAEQEQIAALGFTRSRDPLADEQGYLDVTVTNLISALRRAVEQAGKRQAPRLAREQIPLSSMIERILARLAQEDFVSFSTLLLDDERSGSSFLIVAFLALLELIHRGDVQAYQPRAYDEIRLRRGGRE